MPDYNLHLHSVFSDGALHPEEYVKKAIELGFTSMGFTEHSPLPFDNPFSLKSEKLQEYIELIDELKDKYKDEIKLYRALEMDFIPGISEDFKHWKEAAQADYLIGSVHLVKPEKIEDLWFTDGPKTETYDKGLHQFFNGDIQKAVTAFYHQSMQMIASQDFDVLGHFDKIKMHNNDRFFTENEAWYQQLIDETLDLIQQKQLIVEVNTRGVYKKRSPHFFPDGLALEKVRKRKIPILISSDAHHPDELNMGFAEATKQLQDMGFQSIMNFDDGDWKEQALD